MAEQEPGKPAVDKPDAHQTSSAIVEDDSDPDFDDLDDVLDQFSASASHAAPPSSASRAVTSTSQSQPTPSSSGPGRPSTVQPSSSNIAGPNVLHPTAAAAAEQGADESDDAFMARLTSEMQSIMSQMQLEPGGAAAATATGAMPVNASPEDLAKLGNDLEEFSRQMEADGITPDDFLKALLGTGADAGTGGAAATAAKDSSTKDAPAAAATAGGSSSSTTGESFEERIRRTMQRMGESDKSATNAATSGTGTSGGGQSEEEMFASLLAAMSSPGSGTAATTGGDDDGDGNLSQLFLSMMQQLTARDMLYEPMAELHAKFPAYMSSHRTSLPAADVQRYTAQQAVVAQIVAKFEEPAYSDDDTACRDYVWERMQRMQELGSPPEELVGAGLGGMLGGAGGEPDLAALGLGGGEEGCPTQ